jgi:hypothetical protein
MGGKNGIVALAGDRRGCEHIADDDNASSPLSVQSELGKQSADIDSWYAVLTTAHRAAPVALHIPHPEIGCLVAVAWRAMHTVCNASASCSLTRAPNKCIATVIFASRIAIMTRFSRRLRSRRCGCTGTI